VNADYDEKVRIVPIKVKVVLIGFDEEMVDLPLLKELLAKYRSCLALVDEKDLEVFYNLTYEVVTAPQTFKIKLIKYLKSIETHKVEENPWFYYYVWSGEWFKEKIRRNVDNYLYDARKVEEWLYNNSNSYGGIPEDGYTIIIMDLRELPSITYDQFKSFLEARHTLYVNQPELAERYPSRIVAHYYSVNYSDKDRGYRIRHRDYATGWGGRYRMWFIDLSAGPTFVSELLDLPLQITLEDQGVNLYSERGVLWLTELIADYVNDFVYSVALPYFTYVPPVSSKYKVFIHVLDAREPSERLAVPIITTLNTTLIRDALKSLLPHVELSVEASFSNVTDHPELQSVLKRSEGSLTESWIYTKLLLTENVTFVDFQPVYQLLKNNLKAFVRYEGDEHLIPVFAFALSNDTHFSFKYKWFILRRDPESRTIWGAALKELVLIGLSQKDLLRGNYVTPRQEGKGLGFTQVIIHEVGHMLGLAHPHTYSDVGDFVASAMSYFAYEYGFSQFDKDALLRAHVDKYVIETEKVLNKIKLLTIGRTMTEEVREATGKAEQLLKLAQENYEGMNYLQALNLAVEALNQALNALKAIEQREASTPTLPVKPLKPEASNLTLEPEVPGYLLMVFTLSLIVGGPTTYALSKYLQRIKRKNRVKRVT